MENFQPRGDGIKPNHATQAKQGPPAFARLSYVGTIPSVAYQHNRSQREGVSRENNSRQHDFGPLGSWLPFLSCRESFFPEWRRIHLFLTRRALGWLAKKNWSPQFHFFGTEPVGMRGHELTTHLTQAHWREHPALLSRSLAALPGDRLLPWVRL